MHDPNTTEVRSDSPKKIKKNWLYWFGMVMVAVGAVLLITMALPALSEPSLADVHITSGLFFGAIFALPGLFLIWRSQRVPAADLKYQPLNQVSAPQSLDCPACGKANESPAETGEQAATLQVTCQHCQQDYSLEAKGVTGPRSPWEEMSQELKNWGIGLILIGVLSLVLSEILDPLWGVVLIVLGILSLFIRRPGMFIAIGCGLIVVGIMNLSTALVGGTLWFWAFLGVLQVYWGIQEIRKYRRFKTALEGQPPAS